MSGNDYTPSEEQSRLLEKILDYAKAAGAEAADALIIDDRSVSAGVRLGEVETIERAEGKDLGLRVLIGNRQASASSTDLSDAALKQLAERVTEMAKIAPQDRYCGLADKEALTDPAALAPLDLKHVSDIDADELTAMALACEEAARSIDGVSNSEGAEASSGYAAIALGATNGFLAGFEGTSYSLGVAVLAGQGTGMETDYAYHSTRALDDLESADVIGRRAGKRAVARLSPKRVSTKQVPIIFDRRVAGSLLAHLAGAVNGSAVARGTSFLKNRINDRIMPGGVHVIDDPHRIRGLGSKPFDAEGIRAERLTVVGDGVLNEWLLDLATARQLGLESNGRAKRGTAGTPSPGTTNLFMAAGDVRPYELMADIEEGFLCTSLIGMGVNLVTGDYSRGASGFWIEKGRVVYPVSEITIAGSLNDMFLNLTPADDLEFRGSLSAPSLRVDGMTIAGN